MNANSSTFFKFDLDNKANIKAMSICHIVLGSYVIVEHNIT